MTNLEDFRPSEENAPSSPVRSWISRALDLVPRDENGNIDRYRLLDSDENRRNYPDASHDHRLRVQMAWRAAHGLDPGNFEEQRTDTSKALDIAPRTPEGDIDFYLLELGDQARRRDPERADELLICVEALVALARAPDSNRSRGEVDTLSQPPEPEV